MPGTPPRDVQALQVVVAPVSAQVATVEAQKVEKVKAYCGATRAEAIRPLPIGGPTSQPVPAWADMALSCRMKSAVVPMSESSETGTTHLNRRFHGTRCVFRCLAIISSVFENAACYMAFSEISNAKNELYNKFEAHVLAFDGLAFYLLILASLNSLFLFLYWALIVIVRLDLYRLLSTFRLLLSLPCGALCCLLVLFGEHTKFYPFMCCTLVLVHLEVWLLHEYQIRREKTGKVPKIPLLGLNVIGISIVMWSQMFSVKSVFFLRDDNCPASSNVAMPVHIKEINEWHCVEWGKPKFIKREPASQDVHDVFCSTSFRIFDEVTLSGGVRPSRMAHYVRCPSQCQFLGLGTQVTGCEVYHADSSICSAAVHVGVLEPDRGGIVKVIGRVPPASGKYDRCLRNAVLSAEADFRSGRPTADAGAKTSSSSLLEPPSTQTEFGAVGEPQNGVVYPNKYGSSDAGQGGGEPILNLQSSGPQNAGKCVCVGNRAPIPYDVYMNSTATVRTTATTVTTTPAHTKAATTVTTTTKARVTTTTAAFKEVTVTRRVWINSTNATNGTWKVFTEVKKVPINSTNATNGTRKIKPVVKPTPGVSAQNNNTNTSAPKNKTTTVTRTTIARAGNMSNMTNSTGSSGKKDAGTAPAAPAPAAQAPAAVTTTATTTESTMQETTEAPSTTTTTTEVVPTPEPYELCDCLVQTTTGPPSSKDRSTDWAFYFQAQGMEKLDMVTLHDWKKTSSPGLKEPWKGYTANVSWVVGGTKHNKQIVLGPQTDPDAGMELNFCIASNSSMALECKKE